MSEKKISPDYVAKQEHCSDNSSPPFSSESAAWNSFRKGNESAFSLSTNRILMCCMGMDSALLQIQI